MNNSKQKAIALVSTWFGPFPFWMSAFIGSCKFNADVDWIIFTNSNESLSVPDNVKIYRITVEEFNQLASSKLDYEISISHDFSYKLCDLKIMYGRIYEDWLNNYTFWGCCDLDIVWGDIRKFITNDILLNYDVITSRVGRISGHFCLFRNMQDTNDLYKYVKNVKNKIGDFKNYRGIDENGLTDFLHSYSNSPIFRVFMIVFFNFKFPRIYWNRVLTTSGKHQRQMFADPHLYLTWNNGRTYGVNGEEMMYLHFHEIRKSMKAIDFDMHDYPAQFIVNQRGMFRQ